MSAAVAPGAVDQHSPRIAHLRYSLLPNSRGGAAPLGRVPYLMEWAEPLPAEVGSGLRRSIASAKMPTTRAFSDSLSSFAQLANCSWRIGGMRIWKWTTVSGIGCLLGEMGVR